MSQNESAGKTLSGTNTASSGPAKATSGTPSRTPQKAPQGANADQPGDMWQGMDDAALHELEPPQDTGAVDTQVLQIGSTTLSRLSPSKKPIPSTVCEECPAAVWYARAAKVQCYCRIMHLISWETGQVDPILVCDGPAIAAESAKK